MTAYPKPAAGAPNFPQLETEVLDYWDADGNLPRQHRPA